MTDTPYLPKCYLDGQPVEKITAFLFAKGGNDDPETLLANQDLCFQGVTIHGMGFTFDDSKIDKGANPYLMAKELVDQDSSNAEIIKPLIGWQEITSSPTVSPIRKVIDFGVYSEEEAWKWKSLMEIVEEKVKPFRMRDNREAYRKYWWQFAEKRAGLIEAKNKLNLVFVCSAKATEHLSFAIIPSIYVPTNALHIFLHEKYCLFTILQCRFHEIWARFFGASVEDRLTYTSSSCFHTFPLPENWETNNELETIGEEYYQYRAELMVKNNQGLTDTYNRFHDPDERHPDIEKLRALHQQMDETVLKAYGWDDLTLTCGFDLDYFDLEPENLPPDIQDRIDNNNFFFATAHKASIFQSYVKTGKKSLPWRYRWPQDLHDEILARLLDLNEQRHEQEVLLGTKASKPKGKPASQSKRQSVPKGQGDFLDQLTN